MYRISLQKTKTKTQCIRHITNLKLANAKYSIHDIEKLINMTLYAYIMVSTGSINLIP